MTIDLAPASLSGKSQLSLVKTAIQVSIINTDYNPGDKVGASKVIEP